MSEAGIILEKINILTQGKFVFVKDWMNPLKSYAYGHAGMHSIYIRILSEEFELEYAGAGKNRLIIPTEQLLTELDRFDKEKRLQHMFGTFEKDYSNIMRLSATTINPYQILSLEERKQKMAELFLKHPNFETVEQVDLFLLGTGRVNQFISYNSYGHLEVNYYSNQWNEYFLLDKENEQVVISKDKKEIERYILSQLNVAPETKVEKIDGRVCNGSAIAGNVCE